MESPADGALCYAEIRADDIERVKAFYARVFGWIYRDAPEMDYTFFESGVGGLAGGFLQRTEQSPPHPVTYVMCDDINATLARIEDNGGSVAWPKTEFGELGWLAHAMDTEGNLIGLWQGRDGNRR